MMEEPNSDPNSQTHSSSYHEQKMVAVYWDIESMDNSQGTLAMH